MPALTAEQREMVAAHIRVAERAGEKAWFRFRYLMSREDAIGSACLGLCKAALKYRKGPKPFATYAQRTCIQQVRDDALEVWLIIHIPKHMFNKKKEHSKIYKKRKNAANAAQNRFCSKQAINVSVWSDVKLDTLTAEAEPHRSTEQ